MSIPVAEVETPEVRSDGTLNFDPSEVVGRLRREEYAAPMKSPTRWLPFSYSALPGWVRGLAASLLYWPKRFTRRRQDPSWPVAPSLDVLRWLMRRWPDRPWGTCAWGMAISHDVDTVHGLRRCLEIARCVEAVGFRSCFYIVGEAMEQEPGIVRELRDRGHEIGSHDVAHDNRIAFLPEVEMDDRLKRARESLAPYDGVGFRAPSLYRSPALSAGVARHFAYDSSLCDTDLEFARGCTTVFPFSVRGGREIPITLPMDSSLRYFGCGPSETVRAWKSKCAYLRAIGGLAVSVTHAEPHLSGGSRRLQALAEFLGWVREQEDVSVQLPAEVARMAVWAERE